MKKFITPIVLAGLGAVCIAVFNIIGAKVTAEGIVVEPFFLILLGTLLIVVGVVWAVIAGIAALVKRGNKSS